MAKLTPELEAAHKEQGQLSIKCNRIYKGESANIYLRPIEAIEVARNLLTKAQLLMEHDPKGALAIQVWSASEDTLSFGIENAIKKPRRK